MLLSFSKYPWGSLVLTESSPKSMRLLKPSSNHACQPLASPGEACATGKWNSHPGGEPLIRIPFPLSQKTRFRPQMHFVPPDAAVGCIQLWSAQPHPCPAPCPHSALQYSSNSAWGLSCLRLWFLDNPTKTSLFPPNKTLTANLIIVFWDHCVFEAIEDSLERKGSESTVDLNTGPITYWLCNLKQVTVVDTVDQSVQTSFYTLSSGALKCASSFCCCF